MHDMGHHADLEAAKIQMRLLLEPSGAAEARRRSMEKTREEILGRALALVAALILTAIVWLNGPI